jgi:hypothetical protein
MGWQITSGNDPLGAAGLVALLSCGHWWVYQVNATPEQMHELARFNPGIVCSFCLAGWHAATNARVPGTASRVN